MIAHSSVIWLGPSGWLAFGISHAVAGRCGWSWSYLKALWSGAQDGTLTSLAVVTCWELSQGCWLEHLYTASFCLWDWINVIPRTGPVSFSSIPLVKECMELAQFLGVCVWRKGLHLLMGKCLGYVGCGCFWKMQSAALNLNFLFTKENTII